MKITKQSTTKAIIPELRGKLGAIRYPCFAEIKWDGEAALINYHEEGDIVSINKYGTMRHDWSKLEEIKVILQDRGVKIAMFLAEIYYDDGTAGKLYDLLSHKEDDGLNIKIYDVVHLVWDGQEMIGAQTDLIDRKEFLTDLFKNTPYLCTSKVMNSKDEVQYYFDAAIAMGFEGIVVKNFQGKLQTGPCDWVKMKNKDQSDYVVSLVDPVKERIEVQVPVVPSGKNAWIAVGVKCPNRYKSKVKVGDTVTIEHQGVLDSGSLRHPVFIPREEV